MAVPRQMASSTVPGYPERPPAGDMRNPLKRINQTAELLNTIPPTNAHNFDLASIAGGLIRSKIERRNRRPSGSHPLIYPPIAIRLWKAVRDSPILVPPTPRPPALCIAVSSRRSVQGVWAPDNSQLPRARHYCVQTYAGRNGTRTMNTGETGLPFERRDTFIRIVNSYR